MCRPPPDRLLAAVAGETDLLVPPAGLNEGMRSSDGSWVLANLNVTGYYRVNYDPQNWERLLAQLGLDPQVRCGGLSPVR